MLTNTWRSCSLFEINKKEWLKSCKDITTSSSDNSFYIYLIRTRQTFCTCILGELYGWTDIDITISKSLIPIQMIQIMV